jgi:hypothetical protein
LFPQDGIAGETTRNASAKNKVQSTKNKLPFPNSTQRQMALDRFKDAQRRRRKPVKNSRVSRKEFKEFKGAKHSVVRSEIKRLMTTHDERFTNTGIKSLPNSRHTRQRRGGEPKTSKTPESQHKILRS